MNCSKCRKLIAGMDEQVLPAEIKEHVGSCSECAAWFEQDKALRQLLALKRYEKPDEDFASRNLYAVRQRIAEESLKEADGVPGWKAIWGTSVPALRYVLASVVMMFVAINVFLAPSMPLVQTQLPDSAAPMRMAAERPTIGFGNLEVDDFVQPGGIRIASNHSPDRIQYGTIPSRLVGFEY